MLTRENELRLSYEVQGAYAKYPEDFTMKEKITIRTQRRVCTEFGFTHDMAEGLDLLRSATALFPGDEEVKKFSTLAQVQYLFTLSHRNRHHRS